VADVTELRLAELVAALSLGIDLGFGQPMEHVLRQCLIALRIAERHGEDEESRAVVYYTALLINVGCHSDAHEQAKWFGDDIAMKSGKYESSGLRGAAAMLRMVGAGKPPLHRVRIGLDLVISGRHDVTGMIASHARMAQSLAEQLDLPLGVREAVGSAYEYWNGRGWPGNVAGEAIPIASRVAQLAEYIEVAHRLGGIAEARATAQKRMKTQFDPALVAIVRDHPKTIFEGLDSIRAWDAVIAAEPALAVVLTPDRFEAALLAIANFIDLKSPFTLGHSAAVAELASSAALVMGLPPADVTTLKRAALVHGFGRLGVSNSIWDKPGPLGAGEWERVRMHPYITERMLHHSKALAPLGAIAVQHRERLDGSGYPRGAAGAAISLPARILGAADAYQAMREPRPYRAAHSAADAAKLLRDDARAGRFAPDVVEAVLEGAGHRARQRPTGPAGLTTREVEVLRLIARGLSTKQIAETLGMSPKTAGNHIEHIYAKTNANNRVTASLFAVTHGLIPEE
jgi:HD-GYP domain-containing protein (c-di-GMP phosphodiesterase class II)